MQNNISIETLTLPEKGLNEFKIAFDKNIIELHNCMAKDLKVHLDFPNKFPRFTYALFKSNELIGTCQFAKIINVKEERYQIGYAVFQKYRNQKYGDELVGKSIQEFVSGFKDANGIVPIIEAVIVPNNQVSIKLARKYISQKNDFTIDQYTGENSLYFSSEV